VIALLLRHEDERGPVGTALASAFRAIVANAQLQDPAGTQYCVGLSGQHEYPEGQHWSLQTIVSGPQHDPALPASS
jgi:hypothetical protein